MLLAHVLMVQRYRGTEIQKEMYIAVKEGEGWRRGRRGRRIIQYSAMP